MMVSVQNLQAGAFVPRGQRRPLGRTTVVAPLPEPGRQRPLLTARPVRRPTRHRRAWTLPGGSRPPPPPLLGRSLVTSARRLPLRRRRHFLLQRHPCLPTTVSRDRWALSRDLEVGESSPPTGHYRQLGRRRGGQLRCGRRQVGITRERGTGERERDTWATVATDRGERGSHEVLRGPPIGAGGGGAGTPIRGSKRNSRALTLAGRFGEGAGTRHQPPLLGVRERGRSPGERVEGDRPTRVKETDHAYCT